MIAKASCSPIFFLASCDDSPRPPKRMPSSALVPCIDGVCVGPRGHCRAPLGDRGPPSGTAAWRQSSEAGGFLVQIPRPQEAKGILAAGELAITGEIVPFERRPLATTFAGAHTRPQHQ
jgi:hypothetical protein